MKTADLYGVIFPDAANVYARIWLDLYEFWTYRHEFTHKLHFWGGCEELKGQRWNKLSKPCTVCKILNILSKTGTPNWGVSLYS